jgi:poly-gamma-glutamate capsule biosynthesis protein CapA/YwtB (metallophosphatase superfamily)
MRLRFAQGCLVIFLCGCAFSAGGPGSSNTAAGLKPSAMTATPTSPAARVLPPAAITPTAPHTPSPSPTSAPTEEPHISLAAVGDIMLARSLGDRILQNGGDGIFAAVESTLRSADLAIGNLECAIGDGGVRAPKAYTFRAPAASATLLQKAGFDLLSLANNHSLDYGGATLAGTLGLLEENGIVGIGAGNNKDAAAAPGFFSIRGVRLAFFAFVDVPKEYLGFDVRVWTAGPSSPGVAWAEPEEIRLHIQELRSRADFIIVMLHFGEEGKATPTQGQMRLARWSIDAGADIVIGSHPHILETIEQFKNGIIAYSLGNFVFDGFSGASNDSQILWLTLSPGKPVDFSTIPIRIVQGVPVPSEPLGE